MFYQNVSNYCNKNKISIMAFEEKCGLANGTIGKCNPDRDKPSKPSLDTLEKIEKATKIPIGKWVK